MYTQLRTAALLAAATGGPYVATQTEWGQDMVSQVSDSISTDDDVETTTVSHGGHALHEVEALRTQDPSRYRYDKDLARKLGGLPQEQGDEPSLVGARVTDLREVIRFDISPEWVFQRFARVTTVLADMRLEGLRVPIVTGTRVDDLAGTLTYYFDGSGHLQRVTMHAFTGDPTRLVGAMTQYYGLNRESSLEAGAFTKRWNGQPIHFLRMSRASVVYADAVHQKFTVFLELNQPNLAFGISHEAQRIVDSDKKSGRW